GIEGGRAGTQTAAHRRGTRDRAGRAGGECPGRHRCRGGAHPGHGQAGNAGIEAAVDFEPNFPYYNTVDQIYHAEWAIQRLVRLELLRESIRTLWPKGHPTQLIHVAGTGGKGSTCRFLEMGFGTMGKSGAFMSPH